MNLPKCPLLLFCCVSLLAGCTDASGNRVTMQDWFQGNRAEEPQADEPDHDVATAEPVEEPLAGTTDADAGAETRATASSQRPEYPSDARARRDRPPAGPAGADATAVVRADALIVNDEAIRVSDILTPIRAKLEQLSRELPEEVYYDRAAQLVRMQIVERVAQHLIWRRAQDSITEELKPAIDKAVDRMEKERINREFGGRETSYAKYLAKEGRSRDDVREQLRRTVIIESYLRERLLPLVPMPLKRELMRYYQAHRDEFDVPERREMLIIELPVADFIESSRVFAPTGEERAAARERARKTAEEAATALADGKTFEEVARQYSRGPRREEGGSWGLITASSDPDRPPLKGRWALPSNRLFELSEDEVSEIIEDPAAECLFIVKAGKIEPGRTIGFQDAQPQIIDALRQQRFTQLRADFLQAELEKTTIGSLDDFMRIILDYIPRPRGRGTDAR